jgi:hypothetical protein
MYGINLRNCGFTKKKRVATNFLFEIATFAYPEFFSSGAMLTPLFSLSRIPMYMHVHVYIIYIYIYIYLLRGISHCTLMTTRIVAHAPAQMKCSHSLLYTVNSLLPSGRPVYNLFNQGPTFWNHPAPEADSFSICLISISCIKVRFNRWIIHLFWAKPLGPSTPYLHQLRIPRLFPHPLAKTPTTCPCSTWNSPGRSRELEISSRICDFLVETMPWWPQRINKWYPEITKKPWNYAALKKTQNTCGV